MRRSNGIVTEKAHLNGDDNAYSDGYDRIFGKKKTLELIVGNNYTFAGQTYTILHLAELKMVSKWGECVVYKNYYNDDIMVRSKADFIDNFGEA